MENNTKGTLRYHLQRVTDSTEHQRDSDEHWADLLGFSSDPREWHTTRHVNVSVGLANSYPVSTNGSLQLIRFRTIRLPFWLIFMGACIWILFWLARKHNLLRDRAPVLWKQRKPYSLSAVQAAWWFVLILASFIFIWLITGHYDFSSTALILLGITSGTALGAAVIDANKRDGSADNQTAGPDLNILLSRKQMLESDLDQLERNTLQRNTPAFTDKWGEYMEVIGEIKQRFPRAIGPAHEKFYLDILSDDGGVNFQRFQMLVWSIVLGIFFLHSVLSRLAMPEFSTTLLALMGISAGTYLGFKVPENNNVPTQPPGNNAPTENNNASDQPAQNDNTAS